MKNAKFLRYLRKNPKNLKSKEIVLNREIIFENNIVEFKNVSFQYKNKDKSEVIPKQEHMILDNFSMKFPENKVICIFGPSGTGKTSFVKLIFGAEKPSGGSIFIGGNDISKIPLSKFRKYISYINQNTTNLFNRSLLSTFSNSNFLIDLNPIPLSI